MMITRLNVQRNSVMGLSCLAGFRDIVLLMGPYSCLLIKYLLPFSYFKMVYTCNNLYTCNFNDQIIYIFHNSLFYNFQYSKSHTDELTTVQLYTGDDRKIKRLFYTTVHSLVMSQ
jgi:hypothetical protein